MKKLKTIFLAAIVLVLGLSASTVAENSQAIDFSQDARYAVNIVGGKDTYAYTGNAITPEVIVSYSEEVEGMLNEHTLTPDVDYTVSYQNNTKLGTAKIIVTGIGSYTGEITKTFKITFGTTTLTLKPAYNKITISWKKIPGVTGYLIYRSTEKNSGYGSPIKTIRDGNTTTYVDKSVVPETGYYYKIRAYYKGNESAEGQKDFFSPVKWERARPATTTISSVSRVAYNSLKITWKKVAGATGYAVYRSTSKNGTYTRIGSVKKGTTLSYTDKKCTCAKTYYYKVAAYRKTTGDACYGYKSAAKSGYTKPSKVTVSSNTAYNSTKITLKWKKAPQASGYQIYRSTSKSSGYKKVKTITSGSTLSWTNKGLKKGKVYYYKVRAYKKTGSKTVYGSFSSPYKKTKAGWRYVDGYKLYYNASGKLVKDVSSIIGKQDSYVIKVNKKKNTVTVYAKDGKKGYIIPVKAFICSTGYATPTGTFYTPQKLRWHELMGPCWGQWCTRITGGILFHSVWYRSKNNNNTLSVSAYNKLGTTASHGCVRLTAGDAKWIYDNCDLKTKVIIYNSSDPGPLGKPTAYKLKSNHTWDPTDPNMKAKCKKKGCH